MENKLPLVVAGRSLSVVLGLVILVATLLFLPPLYLLILVVLFRAESFLSLRFARSRRLYKMWIGVLATCVFVVVLSLLYALLRVY
jgi:hypothetical protein